MRHHDLLADCQQADLLLNMTMMSEQFQCVTL